MTDWNKVAQTEAIYSKYRGRIHKARQRLLLGEITNEEYISQTDLICEQRDKELTEAQ